VVIGSLSKLDGGRLRPHKSHRSGRDVDIGMYARNNRELSTFEPLALDQIDYEKTFFLMATLLSTGRVQSIFVNYSVQKGLYEAARDLGYDEKQIDWLFDYPQGRKSKSGVIRHARGHTKHFHVRFACPDGDTCSD
jgi:murein endopeptidase